LVVVAVDDAGDLGARRDWLEPDSRPAKGSVGVAELGRLDACGSEIAVRVGNTDVPLPVVGVIEVPTFTR
jgi:hypothetical protein